MDIILGRTLADWPIYFGTLIIIFYCLISNTLAYTKQGKLWQLATAVLLMVMVMIVSMYLEQSLAFFGPTSIKSIIKSIHNACSSI